MRRAVFFTVFNRPDYFHQTLKSWEDVRGKDAWDFIVRIEPSPLQADMVQIAQDFFEKNQIENFKIMVNSTVLGVLHHPWRGFTDLFAEGYQFVIRAEDDLIVSDDVLEYFLWASVVFREDPKVATVQAFSLTDGAPDEATIESNFSAWTWGTWKDRWEYIIGPTWDHDYSTFNGTSGTQAGWDWNLSTRILPQKGLGSVRPVVSRTNNIGLWGVHGTPENFEDSKAFRPHHDPAPMRLVDSR